MNTKILIPIFLSFLLLSCASGTQKSSDLNQTTEPQLSEEEIFELDKEPITSTKLPSLHILPRMSDEDGNSDDTAATYTLRANEDVNVTIESAQGSWITPMWRYNNSPLPLVIRANRGDTMHLIFQNRLSSDSTIHSHGFKIPADMDGGPDYPVAPDANKTYTFTMNQPAAPLWFHPHPDMQTGKQVYMGLAGVFILEDNITKTLEKNNQLPSGNKDTVLLVQDRRFGEEINGVKELLYMNEEDDILGMRGNTILVNGSVTPKQEVSNTKHRYRLYNVSNARNYDFALSDESNFTIVGSDGGLLKKPVEVNHILLGAAERVEIIIDFSKYLIGEKLLLISKPITGRMSTTTGSFDLPIMRFDINKEEKEEIHLYSELPDDAEISKRLDPLQANNRANERDFILSMGMMFNQKGELQTTFSINGKVFKPNRVDEFLGSNVTEIWKIRNDSHMAHPFHAHATQYQVLDRNGIPASGADLGWKDTFLIQPGETVRIIGKFEDVNKGDYMYHCHILEHEDAGMMGYFRVGPTGHIDSLLF